jgi:serine/threonine protein kinase/tetratricopeptide (TPR) repeat protein
VSTIETVKPMDIIHSRYKILETLGQGGVGTTYKAEDLHTQQYVAIKVVSLRQSSDWKTLDLFEREVKVLQQLNHPAIPRYIDSFEIDTQDDRLFCIVQALAPGKTLAQWIQKGWRPDEDATKAIAVQLLDILVYLQTFLPPILHRDIKPQNILRDREGNIYLVDFGAVQDTYRQTVTGGSTVVGTLGYMAPEQFRGKATRATDLYALGTTLLYLLTGKDPNQLQTSDDLQLQIPSNLRISAEFSRWLKRCIEAAEEDRFNSAALALSALQGRHPKEFALTQTPQRPRNTKISLIKSDRALHIHFSGHSFQSSKADKIRVRIGLILLYLLTAFILFRIVAVSRLNMSEVSYYSLILIAFPCVTAAAGVCFARDLQTLIKPTVLSINDYSITLAGMLKRFEFYQKISYNLEDIAEIHLEKTRKGEGIGVIRTHTQEAYQFGQYLSPTEQRWLVHELQTFIQVAQQRAESRFEQIQDSKLATLDALFQRAISCYQSDQLAQAETLFHAIVLFDAASAEAYNNLGIIQHRLNQHSKSADSFQKALQIAPSYWAARTNFAIALQAQNDLTHAIATYGDPCPTDQTTGSDRYTLILYNQWRGSLADAIADFETPPPDELLLAINIHCRHADLLQCKGDFTTAIDLYRHVLRLARHNPALSAEIYAELAWTFAMMHNLKEAQACLARSRKLAPNTEHKTTRYTEALIQYLKLKRG